MDKDFLVERKVSLIEKLKKTKRRIKKINKSDINNKLEDEKENLIEELKGIKKIIKKINQKLKKYDSDDDYDDDDVRPDPWKGLSYLLGERFKEDMDSKNFI